MLKKYWGFQIIAYYCIVNLIKDSRLFSNIVKYKIQF